MPYTTLIIPEDYDSGTDDEDQNGIDNANKNDGVEISATNTVQANHEEKPIEQSTVGATTVNERIDANENNIHITETTQSTNEILHEIVPPAVSCDVNNGGCDQTCSMVPLEGSGATVAECSCAQGFYLDAYEGRKCFGKCLLGFLMRYDLIQKHVAISLCVHKTSVLWTSTFMMLLILNLDDLTSISYSLFEARCISINRTQCILGDWSTASGMPSKRKSTFCTRFIFVRL